MRHWIRRPHLQRSKLRASYFGKWASTGNPAGCRLAATPVSYRAHAAVEYVEIDQVVQAYEFYRAFLCHFE